MWNISSLMQSYLQLPGREFEAKITLNGVEYGASQIISFSINDRIISKDFFTIGCTIPSTLSIEFMAPAVEENDEIKVFFRMNGTSGFTEWVPMGVYFVGEVKLKNSQPHKIYTVKASDSLIKANAEYISTLIFPASLQAVVLDCCSILGVVLDAPVSNSFMIANEPVGYRIRDILSFASSYVLNSFKMSKDGKLVYALTENTLVLTEYSKANKTGEVKSYTKLTCDTIENVISVGTGTRESELLFQNPWVTEARLNELLLLVNNYTYTPFTLEWRSRPEYETGDWVEFTLKDGTIIHSPILENTISFKGGMKSSTKTPSVTSQTSNFGYEGAIEKRLVHAESEIKYNASQISARVKYADLVPIEGRLTEAESAITQTAGSVTSVVGRVDAVETGKENSIFRQTTAPAHLNGRFWLDTSVTPHVLNVSNGTIWTRATPTQASEVGAFSSAQGTALTTRVSTAESTITQTAERFSLVFTRNLHEMKNKLVYGNTIHMFGSEVGLNAGFTQITVNVPEVYFFSTNQGTNTYNFMNPNIIDLYGLKLGQPYTFSATMISESVPSTAQPASNVGVEVFFFASGASQPTLLASRGFTSIGENITNSLTFTLPANAVGWFIRLQVIWNLSPPHQFMHFLMKNAQLEEGSVATAFSNNASTISGAKYIFDGDNASFYNGGLRIFNNANTQVFGADSNGNLWADSLRIGTNPVWHAGNFNPASYSLIGHSHEAIRFADTRNAVDIPSDKSRQSLSLDFKFNTSVGNPPVNASVSFSHILTVAGWNTNEGSGGWPTQLSVGEGIAFRRALNATTWSAWNSFWHTGNFNPENYSLTSHTHAIAGVTGLQTALDARSLTSHTHANLLPLSGGTMTGMLIGQNSTGAMAVANQGTPSYEVRSDSVNAAYMTFHRAGNYAVRFGLDTDNQLKVGGWSMGAVAHTIWHSGNFNPASYSLTSHTHAVHSAGNGFATSSASYNGSTARTWTIGGGTGITINADDVALTSINAGSGTVGALRYNGTTRSAGMMYGGTTLPTNTHWLLYDGTFFAHGIRWGAGGGASSSDKRMKKDIGSLNYGVDLILNLKPKQFRFKEEFDAPEEVVPSKINANPKTVNTASRDKLHYGLIAQDVEKLLHELGIKNPAIIKEPHKDNKYYGLDYTQLIAPMIATIQSLEKRIAELEKLLQS